MSPETPDPLFMIVFCSIWIPLWGGIGVYLFFKGFREIKYKRIIQDIPTSKINTGAVGTNVEIHGFVTAQRDQLVTAPLSGKTCVLYKIEIQKWVEDDDGPGDWHTIDHYFFRQRILFGR